MTDPCVEKMAATITGYCLSLSKGDFVLLQGDAAAYPLLRETYRFALKAGSHPYVRTQHPELAEILLTEGTDEQISFLPELSCFELDALDARLLVRAESNTRALSGIEPDKLSLLRRSSRPLLERLMERKAKAELRNCVTQFPTDAAAQQAGMSLAEYERFVFKACFVDQPDPIQAWRRLSAEQQHYVDFLDQVSELRFEAPDTELTLSVKARKWINSDGKANFPSGEVFTAPVEDSTQGRIRFDLPTVYQGQVVEGVELEFDRGRVISAHAGKAEPFLLNQLDTDQGSRIPGEIAFGLNYGIDRPTGSILFDEKIGGTIHLALGAGYPDSGSTNKSAIHWDMIRTMNPGRVLADNKLIYENGRFVI